ELLSLDALADDALIVALGSAGSPTIMLEKPSNGHEAGWALDALEAFLGRKTDAIIAFEAGGMNALIPFCAAAERGLPVLDADGMGRAFPEIQMESFSIYGVSATPLALAAELGDRMILQHARDPETAERLIRGFLMTAGGGQCISAEHTMDGDTARRVSIPGTISLCLEIGRLLRKHASQLPAFIADLTKLLAPTHYGEVRKIFEGKVVDIARRVQGGYDYGDLRLASFDADDAPMEIRIKNEYLLALQDGQPVAMTPDLICVLDNETGQPITAETLRYGQRVTVIAIGAPELMRTPRALEVVSPRNFGFEFDYVPIEEL
ncbi:MAG: DUF917 domain-containing protein, partial [Pseudomonadota bacterium]